MWRLIWSPVEYFSLVLAREPRMTLACLAPVVCGVLEWSAAAIVAEKTQPVMADVAARLGVSTVGIPGAQLSVATTIAGYPVAFGLAVLALVCIDVIATDSGRALRLAECAGIAFLAYLPACGALVWAAIAWEATPLDLPAHPSLPDVQDAARRYQADMARAPIVALSRSLYLCSTAWFVALLGVVLKVVSGASVRMATVAAVSLFLAFGGVSLL